MATKNSPQKSTPIERPPVVVIMGHIDHGKSALLDYIRKTNVVADEAGSITQHLGSYELLYQPPAGAEFKKITFLDTPGHAAFTAMRSRGAQIADVAVLVVSAEEGVKPQTLEALEAITKASLPYIVAISKIDKPSANADRVRQDLAAHNIFVEGFGGTVPCVAISSKTGAGVPELMELILLSSAIKELKADPQAPAYGVVIETSLDRRRGPLVTLLLKNGTLRKGQFALIDNMVAPVRALEDYNGLSILEATVSAPVRIIGAPRIPDVGAVFKAFDTKRGAEADLQKLSSPKEKPGQKPIKKAAIPLILKCDTRGALEAIEHELATLETDEVGFNYLVSDIGQISENDCKLGLASNSPLIIGFNVPVERGALAFAEEHHLRIQTYTVIYDVKEMLVAEIEKRRPRIEVEQTFANVKLLKLFSREHDKQVVGGTVTDGTLTEGQVKVLRHNREISRGKITALQQQKLKVKSVETNQQCGLLVDTKISLAPGDVLEAFTLVSQ